MESSDDLPYRYELWKVDTQTLVHGRITEKRLDPRAPELVERGPFAGYPNGYEWRVYQQEEELARWDAVPAADKVAAPDFQQRLIA